MVTKRILAYGEDSGILATRAMVLERAGYDVVQITRAADILPLLNGIFFDLFLVGDSLHMYSNVHLVKQLRSKFPNLLIVMVQDEDDEHDPWSTAFVSSTPERLLSGIHALLERGKKPTVAEVSPRRLRAMHNAAGR